MSESKNRWALEYRPRNFKEVLGQRHVKEFFTTVLTDWFEKQERLPVGVLFSGHSGVGKTTIARIIGAALNCSLRVGVAPCGACPSCKNTIEGFGGGVREIDASFFGNVENIRLLRDELMSYSFAGYQVVIIDECHNMSREAFNVLLKLLEDAPPNLFFILVTTESHKVLETVKSRLLEFTFQPVPFAEISAYVDFLLKKEGVSFDSVLLPKLYAVAKKNVRDFVSNLEQIATANENKIDIDGVVKYFGDIYVFDKVLIKLQQGNVIDGFLEFQKNEGLYSDFALFLNGLIDLVGDKFIQAQKNGSSDASFYDKILSGIYKFCGLSIKLNMEASAKILFLTVFADIFKKPKVEGKEEVGGKDLRNSLKIN